MKDSIFLTILVGVLVFVICQFILKLILDPIVEFKKALGEISHLFLKEQASITNANCTAEVSNEISRLSATLLSLKEAIPFYNVASKFLCLPSSKNIVEACGSLNLISYSVDRGSHQEISETKHTLEIREEMKNLSKALKVRVRYGEL